MKVTAMKVTAMIVTTMVLTKVTAMSWGCNEMELRVMWDDLRVSWDEVAQGCSRYI
jgi:hypothetical protein